MAYEFNGANKKYVSSIEFLDQREILNKVLDIANEEMSFLDIMELTNRSTPTGLPQYHHFINEEQYILATVTAVTGNGTSTVTAQISASDWAKVNEGELVLFPAGEVGYITSKVSTDKLVIKSVNSAGITVNSKVSISAQTLALAAGNKISFFSNASAEGSLSPAAKRWSIYKAYNQVQSFKAKFEITDIQKASKVEVEFGGKPYYMYKAQHDSLMKYRNDISAAFMFGKISDSQFGATSPTLTDADGLPVQTTMGMDQYVTEYGYTNSLLTSGAVSVADLQTLTQQLNKTRCPQEYFLFVGTAQNIAWDNYFNALGSGSIVSQAADFPITKNLDLGIDSVKIYGRTFRKKYLPILDHPNLVNFTGAHNFKDSAYGVPVGQIKTADGQMVNRLGVRYLAGDGTDLRYRETLLGGLAPVPTNERSVLEVHYHSVQGLEILGAEHTFKLY